MDLFISCVYDKVEFIFAVVVMYVLCPIDDIEDPSISSDVYIIGWCVIVMLLYR